MTNKTEMVLVPREFLECIAEKDLCNRTLGELMQWAREVLIRHDAAPAEDVRAVVDEPVYQVRSHGSCCWEDISGESLESCRCQPEHYEIRELFRRPQCSEVSQQCSEHLRTQGKVVMPERKTTKPFQTVDRGSTNYLSGWNACLDEFARLNK